MMNFTKHGIFSIWCIGCLITFSTLPSYAQNMCNLVRLKVEKLKGKVVTNDESPYPFSSTKVELFKANKKNILVGSTVTNKNGFFEIENIESGEYRLVVRATTEKGLVLFTYDVILQVAKNKKVKETNQIIYVRLGENCFDSDAELIDEKPSFESQ